ncbi:MAG: CxxxxCH/CxxCH domain-containing protein [Thermodesulfobacteriota bacterium]
MSRTCWNIYCHANS